MGESKNKLKFFLFYVSGFLLLAYSFIQIFILFGNPDMYSESFRNLLVATTLIFIPLALMFIVWPTILVFKTEALYNFPIALKEVSAKLTDLETIRREHYKVRNNIEAIHHELQEGLNSFMEIQKQFATDQHNILEKELFQERQEKLVAQRLIDSWQKSAIDFLNILERTIEYKLDEGYRKAIDKVIHDFSCIVNPVGLEIIHPVANDFFDERVHEAVDELESSDMKPYAILKCVSWGFKNGTSIIQRAKVILAKAPASKEDTDILITKNENILIENDVENENNQKIITCDNIKNEST